MPVLKIKGEKSGSPESLICHTVCLCETVVKQDGAIAFGAWRITKKMEKVSIQVQATIGTFLIFLPISPSIGGESVFSQVL